jgi:hypothetical protein
MADDVERVDRMAQAIADAQFGGPFNGLEFPEAWAHFETLARNKGRRWWQFWKPKWEPNPDAGTWFSTDGGEWVRLCN